MKMQRKTEVCEICGKPFINVISEINGRLVHFECISEPYFNALHEGFRFEKELNAKKGSEKNV